MKKLVVAVLALVAFNVGFAQEPMKKEKMTPDQMAQKQADDLEKVLSLNADQKATVKSEALTRITKVRAVRAKYGKDGDKKAMHEEIKPIRKAFVDNVNAKLSAEQQTKWKEHRKEKRHEGKGKHEGKGGHEGKKDDKKNPVGADEDDNDDGSKD